MELYFVILWLMFAAYFVWRLYVMIKRLDPQNQEITYLVFLILLGIMGVVSWILPVEISRTVGIVVVIALVVISTGISYKLNQKYENWRQEQLDNEE